MEPSSPNLHFPDHPVLARSLAHVPLAVCPTPVQRVPSLDLYLKRDDLSGPRYGSNKVRKLEYLLAEAERRGARAVFTMGFAGSNHALATALYAQERGLACTALLMPQANAPYVGRNLLASQALGSRLVPVANTLALSLAILRLWPKAHLIPAGGTGPLGVAAYVNAAYELRDQIRAGLLPEPHRVYLPFGSMGTAAGLSLGFQAAGLNTRIIAVRVIESRWAPASGLRRLLRRSLAFLRERDPSFPALEHLGANLEVREEQLGQGYAIATAAGAQATRTALEHTGLELNPTYTAKAFAALLADSRAGLLAGQCILYWNTYNNRDLSGLTRNQDWRALPQGLHRYFEPSASPA